MTLEDLDDLPAAPEQREGGREKPVASPRAADRGGTADAFETAPQPVEAAVRAITDRERLERMAARLLSATDWNDLLTTP